MEKQKGLGKTLHSKKSFPWRVQYARGRALRILLVLGEWCEKWTKFDWLKFSNTCMFIVHMSNASWPTRKKVGENRDKFYLSPTVAQHVVVSFTHANVSWPTKICHVKAALLVWLIVITFILVQNKNFLLHL